MSSTSMSKTMSWTLSRPSTDDVGMMYATTNTAIREKTMFTPVLAVLTFFMFCIEAKSSTA